MTAKGKRREEGAPSEFAVFGKALLEGEVIDGLGALQRYWVGSPALMVRTHGETDPKVREMVSELRRAGVTHRAALLKALAAQPLFLLGALQRCACSSDAWTAAFAHCWLCCRWTVAAKRGLVAEVWRVVVAAQGNGA